MMAVMALALILTGCATTPEGELTDGSKTAWVVGSVLVGSAIIAMAVSDDDSAPEQERNCFIRLNPDGSSDQICR